MVDVEALANADARRVHMALAAGQHLHLEFELPPAWWLKLNVPELQRRVGVGLVLNQHLWGHPDDLALGARPEAQRVPTNAARDDEGLQQQLRAAL